MNPLVITFTSSILQPLELFDELIGSVGNGYRL